MFDRRSQWRRNERSQWLSNRSLVEDGPRVTRMWRPSGHLKQGLGVERVYVYTLLHHFPEQETCIIIWKEFTTSSNPWPGRNSLGRAVIPLLAKEPSVSNPIRSGCRRLLPLQVILSEGLIFGTEVWNVLPSPANRLYICIAEQSEEADSISWWP